MSFFGNDKVNCINQIRSFRAEEAVITLRFISAVVIFVCKILLRPNNLFFHVDKNEGQGNN